MVRKKGNDDVPIESVSKMLGHKNLRSTQHFAIFLDRKVGNDLHILSEKRKAKSLDDGVKQTCIL
mgnify:CR=1 FL=1